MYLKAPPPSTEMYENMEFRDIWAKADLENKVPSKYRSRNINIGKKEENIVFLVVTRDTDTDT